MSIWLPGLAVEVVLRRPRRAGAEKTATNGVRGGREARARQPAVLIEARAGQRRIVVACCGLARAAGVRVGMPVGEARALVVSEGVRVEESQPERQARVLRALAVWAGRFSPSVAVDGADGLLLDVTGCEAIFGGEARLLDGVLSGLRRLGFETRGAIAGTYGCAWAAARYAEKEPEKSKAGPGRRPGMSGEAERNQEGGAKSCSGGMIIEPGRERDWMEGLPMAALRVGVQACEELAELGIDRVGQVLALPRAALPARFGPVLVMRIDQALGRAIELIQPVRLVEPPRVERVFDGPTTDWAAVSITAKELLRALVEELRGRECGVRRLDLELGRCGPGGKPIEPAILVIGLARATRDERHLWSLIGPRLEQTPLGDGGDSGDGIDRVTLTARWTAGMAHEQGAWMASGEEEMAREAARLVDTLVNRLGMERVVRAELCESHIPERAVRWRPAGEGSAAMAATNPAFVKGRPTVLFEEPSSARVMSVTPDGPVVRVRWMGEDLEARACLGPERVEGEWWRPGAPGPGRDYYRVCDQHGRWLWMYRELENGEWYVQGVWG